MRRAASRPGESQSMTTVTRRSRGSVPRRAIRSGMAHGLGLARHGRARSHPRSSSKAAAPSTSSAMRRRRVCSAQSSSPSWASWSTALISKPTSTGAGSRRHCSCVSTSSGRSRRSRTSPRLPPRHRVTTFSSSRSSTTWRRRERVTGAKRKRSLTATARECSYRASLTSRPCATSQVSSVTNSHATRATPRALTTRLAQRTRRVVRWLRPEQLRQLSAESALLVYGRLPPTVVQLRMWFSDRHLKKLAGMSV